LHEYGDDWITSSPRRLVDKALNGLMDRPGQQIIVMSQVLVDDINTGYQQFQNLQVCGGGEPAACLLSRVVVVVVVVVVVASTGAIDCHRLLRLGLWTGMVCRVVWRYGVWRVRCW
jgi:hypothetical protein